MKKVKGRLVEELDCACPTKLIRNAGRFNRANPVVSRFNLSALSFSAPVRAFVPFSPEERNARYTSAKANQVPGSK